MQQVEARTHGHPTVLLFTAQGCASCVATARALQDAAGGGSEVRLVLRIARKPAFVIARNPAEGSPETPRL
jgi:hypothetical protein